METPRDSRNQRKMSFEALTLLVADFARPVLFLRVPRYKSPIVLHPESQMEIYFLSYAPTPPLRLTAYAPTDASAQYLLAPNAMTGLSMNKLRVR